MTFFYNTSADDVFHHFGVVKTAAPGAGLMQNLAQRGSALTAKVAPQLEAARGGFATGLAESGVNLGQVRNFAATRMPHAGAATGAVGGGLAGAIGAGEGNRLEGALGGAAVGAGLGAAAGKKMAPTLAANVNEIKGAGRGLRKSRAAARNVAATGEAAEQVAKGALTAGGIGTVGGLGVGALMPSDKTASAAGRAAISEFGQALRGVGFAGAEVLGQRAAGQLQRGANVAREAVGRSAQAVNNPHLQKAYASMGDAAVRSGADALKAGLGYATNSLKGVTHNLVAKGEGALLKGERALEHQSRRAAQRAAKVAPQGVTSPNPMAQAGIFPGVSPTGAVIAPVAEAAGAAAPAAGPSMGALLGMGGVGIGAGALANSALGSPKVAALTEGEQEQEQDRSLIKDFAGGIDPTGTFTFGYGVQDPNVSDSHEALRTGVATAGGLLGGGVLVPGLVGGLTGAAENSGKGWRGMAAGAAKGAVSPFKQLMHAPRAIKGLRNATQEGMTAAQLKSLRAVGGDKIPGFVGKNIDRAIQRGGVGAGTASAVNKMKNLGSVADDISSQARSGAAAIGLSAALGGGSAAAQYNKGQVFGKQLSQQQRDALKE